MRKIIYYLDSLLIMKYINILALFFVLAKLTAQQTSENPIKVLLDSTNITTLEEVVVTATRTKRQVSSLPLPVLLIGKKELEQSNTKRLHHLLNEQTGLITIPDFGGGEGIQLQGLDSEYTLILIDGVPLIGRSAGTLDLSRVTVGNIKQIEIVKGASSSLYGSEALGGVINIITDTPTEGFKSTLDYSYASNNNHDTSIDIAYKKNKFSIATFANRYSTDGFDLTPDDGLQTIDPFSNYTFSTKIKYTLNEDTDLVISGRYYTQNQDYVASETIEGIAKINEWNSRIKLTHTYNKHWKSYLDFYATNYQANEQLNNNDGSLYSKSSYDELLLKPEYRLIFTPGKKNTYILGIGTNYASLKRTDFSTDPIFNAPYLYTQWDGNPTKKLNLIIGARFDYHSKYASQFSPKIAAHYKITSQISVKGAIGYGFKTPDFRQLYFDFTNSSVGYTVLGYNAVATKIPEMDALGLIQTIQVPLTDFQNALKPENSISINIGGRYSPTTTLFFDLNVFRNNIKDLIDTRVIANKTNGQNVFSYYNVNKVVTEGMEFNATFKPSNQLKISGGYQLLFAKDSDAYQQFKRGEVYARNPETLETFKLKSSDYIGLYNRSKHMFNFKIYYSIPSWKLDTNFRFTYRSKYGLYDSNSNNFLDTYDDFVAAYSICNWAVNKKIGKKLRIGFGIDNLFDFTNPQHINNISGRIIYTTLNYQF